MVDEKCDGQSQSPIDIAKSASLNQSLTKVELASSWDTSSLGSSTKFELVNKGYTVQLTIDSNVEITSTQSGKTFHEQSLTTQQKFTIKDFFRDRRQQICSQFIKNPSWKFYSLPRCIQSTVIYLRWSSL